MAELGNPDEYEAWIYSSKTWEKLTSLPWSQIKWQRVRNKVSVGSVFVAEDDGGIECCGAIGGLRAWSMSLVIERNGTNVWDGPIIGWSRPAITAANSPRGVTITANDRMRLAMHRLVSLNRTWPSTFGQAIYTANLQQLMYDASMGDIAYDPYPFTLPHYNSGLDDDPIVEFGLDEWVDQAQALAYDLRRELKVDRLATVFSVLDDVCTAGGLYYSMAAGVLHMNEMLVRTWLDDQHPPQPTLDTTNYELAFIPRPALTDDTVLGIPGINVDGGSLATDYFEATAGQGENGFPQVGSANIYGGVFIDGVLDLATNNDQQYTEDDTLTTAQNLAKATYIQGVQAQYEAVEAATPHFTIEQTRLSPTFGSDAMKADLTNLLPGVLVNVNFESTCAFDVPMTAIDYWYREFTAAAHSGAGYFLTPLYADAVRAAKLEQLDVTVNVTDAGIDEEVLASFTPWADWNGELPDGWLEPSYFALGY